MDSINLNDIFLHDDYSIEKLLAEAKRHKLSLAQLRDRLLQHQQDLNQTSLELFNNNYDGFYKLSYIISCLAEPIKHLIEPIQSFRDQLGNLCQNNDAYVDEINNKLSALEETGRNKELAKRLILLIRKRDRIEQQFQRIDWSIKPIDRRDDIRRVSSQSVVVSEQQQIADIEYKIKCDLLERINIELHHLLSQVRAIQPSHDELIPIKKSLESSLEQRQSQLDAWFQDTYFEAHELRDEQMIEFILKTYKQKNAARKLGRYINKGYLETSGKTTGKQ